MKEIFLCAINNVLSGTCHEDCKFCTQSIKYKAKIQRYKYKDIQTIVSEAKAAHSVGALGYCLVTAGKGLDDTKCEYIAKVAYTLKQELPSLNLIACNGTATKEQLIFLKQHGIDSYNHNLETSPKYYNQICTTHTYQERLDSCESVKSAGLALCCGGIFGMGESATHRDELLQVIKELNPNSVPLNFYHPNPALPIKERDITLQEALDIISKTRTLLGMDKIIMVAGGRELLFGGNEAQMYSAGANAIVIGDYLTTKGASSNYDIITLKQLGYKVAKSCDTK
jgi:biotin synthase